MKHDKAVKLSDFNTDRVYALTKAYGGDFAELWPTLEEQNGAIYCHGSIGDLIHRITAISDAVNADPHMKPFNPEHLTPATVQTLPNGFQTANIRYKRDD